MDWFNAVDLTYQNQLRELNEMNWERFKAEVRAQGAEIRAEMRTEIAKVRQEMLTEIAKLRAEMHAEIARLRSDMMKWMFIYWTGTMVPLLWAILYK